MMVDKEDLGLSLTLGFGNPKANHGTSGTNSFSPSLDPHLLQLNLMSSHSPPLPNLPFSSFSIAPLRNPFASSSSDRASEAPCRVMAPGDQRSFPKGIDVNRLPASAAEDDVSSPNSTLSSVSGKRGEHVGAGEDLDADRACSRGISDEEDGETSRKKLRLSKEQSAVLEETFKEHSTLNPKQKLALANRLGLRSRQVEVWFQNRRARTKLKQTEVDCEFLKRCCDQLTEENRRLQKEVQELRSLKLSPQFYMQMTPPTTLTMCPSCERVGTKASSVI